VFALAVDAREGLAYLIGRDILVKQFVITQSHSNGEGMVAMNVLEWTS